MQDQIESFFPFGKDATFYIKKGIDNKLEIMLHDEYSMLYLDQPFIKADNPQISK